MRLADQLPPNPDPLGEVLHALRMSSTFTCRSELSAPWGVDMPPMEDALLFHFVMQGRCWVRVPGAEPRVLSNGGLALVARGAGHELLSDPDAHAAPLFDLPRTMLSERYEVLRHGGGGEPTLALCGAVQFSHPLAREVLQLLPPLLTLDTMSAPEMEWTRSTLQLMAEEAQALRPGGETVLTRLSDVLVIQMIRAWLREDPAAQAGWLGALSDGQLGKALSAVHRAPGEDWTLQRLASEAGMSRSAFAARFTELVGEPAMQYVTRFRMRTAMDWLCAEGAGMGEVAERLGYRSEAAFSRAFKRTMGMSPGAVRRSAS